MRFTDVEELSSYLERHGVSPGQKVISIEEIKGGVSADVYRVKMSLSYRSTRRRRNSSVTSGTAGGNGGQRVCRLRCVYMISLYLRRERPYRTVSTTLHATQDG